MISKPIRFAIGSPDNPASAVWRMWVQGDDVYLGVRDFLGAYKISLHASGIWRVARVKELDKKDSKNDRLLFRWSRPTEFLDGWTASMKILVSPINPARPLEKIDNSKLKDPKITWISCPKEGNRINFTVLFSQSEDFNIANKISDTHSIVAKMKKHNGEHVWLLAVEAPLDGPEIKQILEILSAVKIHMKQGSSEDTPLEARAGLVTVPELLGPSTQPVFFEVALGKDNLEIPQKH